jgi:phenylpropionate dioxygenase-like ring-hydroxylating dioxygenase large terminal subunit
LEKQMTTREQNELLTRTAPGTPMGELFRRYWLPALLSEELPEPGCPPVRVKLLSERLLAFRDSSGKLGLVDEFCAHRGVSLWFGRNEQEGLRCPYHGWKYDVAGQCVEVPSEPVESGYAEKIRLRAYPLIERGGVLWTYMGPPELQPPLPEFEFAMVGTKHRYVSKRLQESNWLQAMEGGIDSSHSAFLHRGELHKDPLFESATISKRYSLEDFQVRFEVVDSDSGLWIGSRRKAENGNFYWRVTQWVMPCFTAVPPHGDNSSIHGHFWVPIDDESCWAWSYNYHPDRELTDREVQLMKEGYGVHVKLIPGTYIPMANRSNDYLMDRVAQKAGTTYSGVEGIAIQDASLQESMGPIQDRSRENLVSTDNGVIMTRGRLRKAALALQKGEQPPGRDPVAQRVRPAALVLPPDVTFKDAARDALTAQANAKAIWL